MPTARKESVEKAEGIVMAWFNTSVANSPTAQHTPGINHLMSVLPNLVADVAAAIDVNEGE